VRELKRMIETIAQETGLFKILRSCYSEEHTESLFKRPPASNCCSRSAAELSEQD
jgi:hypothetical protein